MSAGDRPVGAEEPAAAFPVAPFLREIGRGKGGSRALSRERARELFAAILAGAVDDVSLGGVLLALRMKGEEAPEIAGFLDALELHLARAPAVAPAWIVLPSYNGARTIANLVPLLALLLARAGRPVLVHGQASESAAGPRRRVTSAAIFDALGVPRCMSMADAAPRATAGLPAVIELQAFAPELSRLIGLRAILGVRNVAHTLAKLVRPVEGPSLLISSYTHPDFGRLQAELFRDTGAHAMSLRGTDGEAVISARRAQAGEIWSGGTSVSLAGGGSVARADDALPDPAAAETAEWTREVLAGRIAVPAAIQMQFDAICAELTTLENK